MNADTSSARPTSKLSSQLEPQIHPQLQPEICPSSNGQLQGDAKAQPELHPALGSQNDTQAPVIDLTLRSEYQVPGESVAQKPEFQGPFTQVATQPEFEVPAFQNPFTEAVLPAPQGPIAQPEPQLPAGDVVQNPAFQGPFTEVAHDTETRILAEDVAQRPAPQVPFAQVTVKLEPEAQVTDITPRVDPEPVASQGSSQSSPQVGEAQAPTGVVGLVQGLNIAPPPVADSPQFINYAATDDSHPSSEAVVELQERAKLAASRVRLMDTTIDILLTTFRNKYSLDKELDKRYGKLIKASGFESTNAVVKADLKILADSLRWVDEYMTYLEECLHSKHLNIQVAGPLVDAKRERRLEEKQVRKIEKVASKIKERALKRQMDQEKPELKQSGAVTVLTQNAPTAGATGTASGLL